MVKRRRNGLLHGEFPSRSRRVHRTAHSFSLSDKTWCVNGGITVHEASRRYYVNPGTQEETELCLNAVEDGTYLLLAGARASGKTTRLFWLGQEIQAMDHCVL